jgi:N-methylhydantoinase B
MNDSLMAIPGSEAFNSRPLTPGQLRPLIGPTLAMHDVTDAEVNGLDPLTYEVIRHRIWSITDEMGETLKKMSGAPGVTESNDFDFAICDAFGQEVQVGLYNTFLVASMDLAIYWMLQHRSANPGIGPGDMFLANDPWVGGGLHQNDTAIIAPVFWEGELFGWTSAVCHLTDIGGAKPGSIDLGAQDVFTEGVPTPPIKIVRAGEVQADVVDMFVRRSRMPHLVDLELRAMLGANRAGHVRIERLIARYGPDVVKAVMKRMMNDGEQRLRDRLKAIPDGSWRGSAYLEQSAMDDRGLHKIQLTLTKRDESLTFDFTGTDPQAGMVNCPYSGVRGGVMVGILSLLAGDMPWSPAGFMRCVELITEEGTINNASYPAAIGWAPLCAVWVTLNVVVECLGKMLDESVAVRPRAQAGCTGTGDVVTLVGTDQRGETAVMLLMEGDLAGGFGAHPDRDGADTAGIVPIPLGRISDAEVQEFMYPVLYLWRHEQTDSGGPGRFRGGAAISVGVIVHGTNAPMMGQFNCNGKARPEGSGLAGGYPGATAFDAVVRGADVQALLRNGVIPTSMEDLDGEVEIIGNRLETTIDLADALSINPSGGGGYGDPLLRDPALVALDVQGRLVSAHAATSIYGVVLDDSGTVDLAGTEAVRYQIRTQRLGGLLPRPVARHAGLADTPEAALDGNVVLVDVGGAPVQACLHCGHEFGPTDGAVTASLVRHVSGAGTAGPGIRSDASTYVDSDMVFMQDYCPGCGTAYSTQIMPGAVT